MDGNSTVERALAELRAELEGALREDEQIEARARAGRFLAARQRCVQLMGRLRQVAQKACDLDEVLERAEEDRQDGPMLPRAS